MPVDAGEPNRDVQKFLSTPIPSEVWHYTNLAGFEGILSSGTVWATEAHYTTDPEEFVHARDIAIGSLNALQVDCEADKVAKDGCLETIRGVFEKGSLSQSKIEVFVASFSAAEDLKSQWTAYADSGRGVCLGFD